MSDQKRGDDENDERLILHLRFQPLWLYIDAMREFCAFLVRTTLHDKEIAQRIELVVQELLENAIRHGEEEAIELRITQSDRAVRVAVQNAISAPKASTFEKTLEEVRDAPPEEAYHKALARTAKLPPGLSGVGLSRLRYEGAVELSATFDPGWVEVTATGTL